MNNRTTKFVPEIKHALDIKGMRTMRAAVNSLLNAKVIQGQKADSHFSDGNVVYEIPLSASSSSSGLRYLGKWNADNLLYDGGAFRVFNPGDIVWMDGPVSDPGGNAMIAPLQATNGGGAVIFSLADLPDPITANVVSFSWRWLIICTKKVSALIDSNLEHLGINNGGPENSPQSIIPFSLQNYWDFFAVTDFHIDIGDIYPG